MENLAKTVKNKMNALNSSPKTLKTIFNIIHDMPDKVFAEQTVGYKNTFYTYKDVSDYSFKVAKYISSNITLKKGSFIGLHMENSYDYIAIFWGILISGYKPLLINVRLGNNLNEKVCKLANVGVVISNTNLPYVAHTIIFSDKKKDILNLDIKDFIPTFENEIALSTSGTSLDIKLCVYDGFSICEQIKNADHIISSNSMIKARYNKDIKLLTFLPFYHIFGLVACYLWFAFFSRTFVFLNNYSPACILSTVKSHKVTHLFAVPMLWNQVSKEILKSVSSQDKKTQEKFYKALNMSHTIQKHFPIKGRNFVADKLLQKVTSRVFGSSLLFAISGGSMISHLTLRLLNGLGYPLFNGYGMSEIGITSVELSKDPNIRDLGYVGLPFKTVEYKIIDSELYVKASSMACRIISTKGVTNIDKNKFFATGDLAEFKDNNYAILGRKDDLVIGENGENINPDNIETLIDIPSAVRLSCLGLEDENKDEKLMLVVQIQKQPTLFYLNMITNEINKSLNKLKENNVNLHFVYVTYDDIASPLAIKVSRTILKKWIENKEVNLIDYNKIKCDKIDAKKANEEVLLKVKQLFAKVLNIDIEKVDDNSCFMGHLSGTSLDYFSLINEIEEEFGGDYSDYMGCSTPYDFALTIVKRTKNYE